VVEGMGCQQRPLHSFGECRVMVGHMGVDRALALVWRAEGCSRMCGVSPQPGDRGSMGNSFFAIA
jgi:hypothetical protein